MSAFVRLVALVVLCIVAVACGRPDNGTDPAEAVGVPPPSPSTPGASDEETSSPASWGARLEKAHAAADRASTPAERSASARRLAALGDEVPSSSSTTVQTELRDDLAARAGHLYLEAKLPEEARQVTTRALAHPSEASVSRAHLLMALADAEEALGHPKKARVRLMEALTVNQELLEKELETP